MTYIPLQEVTDIFTTVYLKLYKDGKLATINKLLASGDIDTVKSILNAELINYEQLMADLDPETAAINQWHKTAISFITALENKEQALEEYTEYLSKIENLLWENLENFNKLRADYSVAQIKEIFKTNKGKPKTCEECDKLFVATSPRQKFCSIDCRKKAASKRHDKTV